MYLCDGAGVLRGPGRTRVQAARTGGHRAARVLYAHCRRAPAAAAPHAQRQARRAPLRRAARDTGVCVCLCVPAAAPLSYLSVIPRFPPSYSKR